MDFCLHHHVEYGRDDDTDYGPRVRKRAAEPAGGNGLAVVADIDGRVARVQGNLERFLNTSYRSIELLFARSRGLGLESKTMVRWNRTALRLTVRNAAIFLLKYKYQKN